MLDTDLSGGSIEELGNWVRQPGLISALPLLACVTLAPLASCLSPGVD